MPPLAKEVSMLELVVTRFIKAPPEKVWDAMVNRIGEWFCPQPWRAEPGVQERRPGGRAEMTMFGPNGEEMPQNGTYLAWDEGRRFAMTDAIVGDLEPAGPFMIGIWDVAADTQDGVPGTLYTARARHWTEEALKQHEAMGFEAGWGLAADQLAALCE
jgi:uncharacterized protein YndB with AHSA1/START domain